jgi:hypothetical protein
MKMWMIFVVCTILCWGAYVPTLHSGQLSFGGKSAPLRAFMFVGAAYFLISIAVLAYVGVTRAEPMEVTNRGAGLSTIAGILGALGALGIVFALLHGGRPIYVAPIVFAGAPIVNTIVSMIWHKPAGTPHPLFYAGIALAAVGASMVLRFKPV